MEGADHQRGMMQQHHRTSGGAGAFDPPQVPRPPNQKPVIPPSHPNTNMQVPPSSSIPYPQFSPHRLLRSPGSSSHSRSLSQPPFFLLDSLPPLHPSHANLIPISTDVVMSAKENPTLSLNRGVNNQNTFQSVAHGASSSFSGERREGVKRSSNGDILPTSQHHRRSFSLDNSTGNFHIQEGVPKFPPLNNQVVQLSRSNSMDSRTSSTSLEFGNSVFNAEEMKKIMESDKLVEIALSDPKLAKRILANRQSATRSKEKKMQYITELEHKLQTLQTETTTLSTQVTKLQRDNSELRNENKEYKLRLQAREQQSQLKDALNEKMDTEVRHLRRVVADLGGESLTNAMARQLATHQQRFQLQHQQPPNQQQQPNQQ